MKRLISLMLAALLLISAVPTLVSASEANTSESITYFEDGSYLVETVYVSPARASGTITGSKESAYYANDGTLEWKAVLTGSFTYTGTSATCTTSSCNITIYDSSWYNVSKSVGKNGSSATSSVTMGNKLLGVTVTKITKHITLTCDANGNLS